MASLHNDLDRAATAAARIAGPSLAHLKRLNDLIDPSVLRRIQEMEAQFRRLANPLALQRMREMEAQIQRFSEPANLSRLTAAANDALRLQSAAVEVAAAQRLFERFADQALIGTIIGMDRRISEVIGSLPSQVDNSLIGRIADIMGDASKFSAMVAQVESSMASVPTKGEIADLLDQSVLNDAVRALAADPNEFEDLVAVTFEIAEELTKDDHVDDESAFADIPPEQGIRIAISAFVVAWAMSQVVFRGSEGLDAVTKYGTTVMFLYWVIGVAIRRKD